MKTTRSVTEADAADKSILIALKKKYCSFGYTTWFQNKLADQVIQYGLNTEKDRLGTPRTRQRLKLKPECMPKHRYRGQTKLPQMPSGAYTGVPISHKSVNVRYHKIIIAYKGRNPSRFLNRARCKSCYRVAKAGGRRAEGIKSTAFRMPDGKPVPYTFFGCTACRKNLCEDCHMNKWDHNQQCLLSESSNKTVLGV